MFHRFSTKDPKERCSARRAAQATARLAGSKGLRTARVQGVQGVTPRTGPSISALETPQSTQIIINSPRNSTVPVLLHQQPTQLSSQYLPTQQLNSTYIPQIPIRQDEYFKSQDNLHSDAANLPPTLASNHPTSKTSLSSIGRTESCRRVVIRERGTSRIVTNKKNKPSYGHQEEALAGSLLTKTEFGLSSQLLSNQQGSRPQQSDKNSENYNRDQVGGFPKRDVRSSKETPRQKQKGRLEEAEKLRVGQTRKEVACYHCRKYKEKCRQSSGILCDGCNAADRICFRHLGYAAMKLPDADFNTTGTWPTIDEELSLSLSLGPGFLEPSVAFVMGRGKGHSFIAAQIRTILLGTSTPPQRPRLSIIPDVLNLSKITEIFRPGNGDIFPALKGLVQLFVLLSSLEDIQFIGNRNPHTLLVAQAVSETLVNSLLCMFIKDWNMLVDSMLKQLPGKQYSTANGSKSSLESAAAPGNWFNPEHVVNLAVMFRISRIIDLQLASNPAAPVPQHLHSLRRLESHIGNYGQFIFTREEVSKYFTSFTDFNSMAEIILPRISSVTFIIYHQNTTGYIPMDYIQPSNTQISLATLYRCHGNINNLDIAELVVQRPLPSPNRFYGFNGPIASNLTELVRLETQDKKDAEHTQPPAGHISQVPFTPLRYPTFSTFPSFDPSIVDLQSVDQGFLQAYSPADSAATDVQSQHSSFSVIQDFREFEIADTKDPQMYLHPSSHLDPNSTLTQETMKLYTDEEASQWGTDQSTVVQEMDSEFGDSTLVHTTSFQNSFSDDITLTKETKLFIGNYSYQSGSAEETPRPIQTKVEALDYFGLPISTMSSRKRLRSASPDASENLGNKLPSEYPTTLPIGLGDSWFFHSY